MVALQKHPILLLLPVLVIASAFGFNHYYFGMWNQFLALPWLYNRLDPNLFPHDMAVEQAQHSPSVFWALQEYLLPLFGNNIALMYLCLYLLALAFSFYAFYGLGKQLHQSKRAGIISLVALSFSVPVIGDVELWSTLFMERGLAFPLLIFSLYFLLRGQEWAAVFLQALAFNIHPLSAFYVVLAAWAGVLLGRGWRWVYFAYAGLFLLVAAPVLYLAFSRPTVAADGNLEAIWLEVMKLRNAHHALPSAFPWSQWLKSALFASAFFVFLGRAKLPGYYRKFALGFALMVLLMLITGTVFTEWLPLKQILQFQFFRSFRFVIVLGLAYYAGALVTQSKAWHYWLLPGFMAIYFYGGVSKSLAAVATLLLATYLLLRWRDRYRPYLVLVIWYLGLGASARFMHNTIPWNRGTQKDSWYAMQNWAFEQSARDALFIVPPQVPGFRVESKRSIYGDWYDGTKAFFSAEYAQYWLEHMKNLNCYRPDSLRSDYLQLKTKEILNIAQAEEQRHSEIYFITYAERPLLPFEQKLANKDFVLYRLK